MRLEVNVETGEVVELPDAPATPVAPPTADENKAKAEALLADSDWVELPSVSDTNNTPHLTNVAAINEWRASIRAIAVNPTAGDLVWPVKPDSVWAE